MSDTDLGKLRVIIEELAKNVRYGGNPEHKRNQGDFKLTPASAPRRGKSLCDDVSIFTRAEAVELLRRGLGLGLVDGRWNGEGWPQNVWVVMDTGCPLEAELEGPGVYHGYPMPDNDPFRTVVLERWSRLCAMV